MRVVKVLAWAGIAVFVLLALNEVVFSRPATEAYQLNFHPFWSYEAIMNGRKDLIKEHYLNVAVFIPLGIMLWVVLRQKKLLRALVFGCAVSLLIEIMQLTLKRGLCEFDDVMHNTLGCMIGYGLVKCVSLIVNNIRSLRIKAIYGNNK